MQRRPVYTGRPGDLLCSAEAQETSGDPVKQVVQSNFQSSSSEIIAVGQAIAIKHFILHDYGMSTGACEEVAQQQAPPGAQARTDNNTCFPLHTGLLPEPSPSLVEHDEVTALAPLVEQGGEGLVERAAVEVVERAEG
jgi:hypothetical protein